MPTTSVTRRLAAVQRQFRGVLGVAARDLASGAEIRHNVNDVFSAASCIKVPVLVEVFRQVEAGHLSLDEPIPYTAAHRVPGSGVLKDLTVGRAMPLRDAVTLMIIISDNTATNMVIDAVGGVGPVNRTMTALGVPQLILNRHISFTEEGPLAVATPAAFCDLLTGLARGEVISATASQAMVEILKRQQYTDRIGRYIPYDGDAYEEDPEHHLGIASKSGSVRGVRNDVGIVFPPGRAPYVVCLLSRDCPDERYWPENEGVLAIARASRIIYEAFVGS